MRNYILAASFCFATLLCTAQNISFRVMVYDKINRQPIMGAMVKLQDLSTMHEYNLTSNENGAADFSLSPAERYRLEVNTKDDGSGTGYLSYTYILSEKEARNNKALAVDLERVKRSESGAMPALHFDYNSPNLSAENKTGLDNLVKMLKNFPTLQIEIGVYADCRENETLVTRRAAAIKEYLAKQGETGHATVKEFGNVRPLNQCNCSLSKDCPEQKFAENRRAEFKVIAF